MTSWVVADSGILLATFLPEKYTLQAKKLLRHWQEETVQIGAPILFHYEIVAVIRKNVYRSIITAEEAAISFDALLQYPVQLFMDNDLLKRAYELATKFNRPTAYDAQYLAVAERLGCEFWTADERMYNALKQDLTWIRWLGNFTV